MAQGARGLSFQAKPLVATRMRRCPLGPHAATPAATLTAIVHEPVQAQCSRRQGALKGRSHARMARPSENGVGWQYYHGVVKFSAPGNPRPGPTRHGSLVSLRGDFRWRRRTPQTRPAGHRSATWWLRQLQLWGSPFMPRIAKPYKLRRACEGAPPPSAGAACSTACGTSRSTCARTCASTVLSS